MIFYKVRKMFRYRSACRVKCSSFEGEGGVLKCCFSVMGISSLSRELIVSGYLIEVYSTFAS